MIQILSPEYIVTVGNAYVDFVKTIENGTHTYDAKPFGVNTVKEIGLTRNKATSEIYASGMVFKTTSAKTGIQIDLGVVSLPPDFLTRAQGQKVSANKGFSFETANDKSETFAFGHTIERSDGKKVFTWHPRCELITVDNTVATSGKDPVDPNYKYVINVLPYGKHRIISAQYDQSTVDPAKVPLTEEKFFAQVVDAIDHAIVDTEENVGG